MIVVFPIALALITFWVHRRLVRATRLPAPWSRVVDAGLIVLWGLASLGIATGRELDPAFFRAPAWLGLTWLATVLYLVLGLSVVAVLSLIARVVGRRSLRVLRAATGVVAVTAVAVTAYGVVEAHQPQVTHTRIDLATLPAAFDGLRVALITDLHVGPARGRDFTADVVDRVNAEHPDLVAIGGDLTDGTVAKVADTLEPLTRLRAPLGVFGVSGNHEYYSDDGGKWLDAWERMGVHTLRNQRVEITRDGARIDVAGISDATAPAPYEPDLDAVGQARGFTLLLAHQPRQATAAAEHGVDLQLSGHTHGGQLWPIRYLVPLQQPSVQGTDRVGNTTLYTSRGAGAWGPPVRVGATPEIAILELRRAPP
ncbi:MAG: metallophosphoesterase [Gordonia sp. (in: high G+C Gram-positive bacteria)]